MKAVVYDRYGPPQVQRLEDVERPVPEADEVLVKIHATTVTRSDCGWRSGEPFFARVFTGLLKPRRRILGMEYAGAVEAVGAGVTEFAVRDEVFGVKGTGAHAEFVCVGESAPIAHKPASMTFQEAAAVCDGACSALSCLRGELREGRSILVYGASGSIGSAAVQLAKHFGLHVTAVCNTKSVELLRSLGADVVIDYKAAPLEDRVSDVDVVLDPIGGRTAEASVGVLNDGGSLISLAGPPTVMLPEGRNLSARFFIVESERSQLIELARLVDDGRLSVEVSEVFPLRDAAAAYDFGRTARRRGKIVLQVTEA